VDNSLLINGAPSVEVADFDTVTSVAMDLATEAGAIILVPIVWGNNSAKGTPAATGDETYTLAYTGSEQHRLWIKNGASVNADNDVSVAWTGTFNGCAGMLTWR
jgi:hypothetical protein